MISQNVLDFLHPWSQIARNQGMQRIRPDQATGDTKKVPKRGGVVDPYVASDGVLNHNLFVPCTTLFQSKKR